MSKAIAFTEAQRQALCGRLTQVSFMLDAVAKLCEMGGESGSENTASPETLETVSRALRLSGYVELHRIAAALGDPGAVSIPGDE